MRWIITLACCVVCALSSEHAAAQVDCGALRAGVQQGLVSPDFYAGLCGGPTQSGGEDLPAFLQVVRAAVASGEPISAVSIPQIDPFVVLRAIAFQSFQGSSLLRAIDWRANAAFASFLSGAADRPFEELGRGTRTTLFWFAIERADVALLTQIASNRMPWLAVIRENAVLEFPCAANVYLCLARHEDLPVPTRQALINILGRGGVPLPEWTLPALRGVFQGFAVPSPAEGPRPAVCSLRQTRDCDLMEELIQTGLTLPSGALADFGSRHYVGYDPEVGSHLLSGVGQDRVHAFWIGPFQGSGNGPKEARAVIIIAPLQNGALGDFTVLSGKRIERSPVQVLEVRLRREGPGRIFLISEKF